MYEGQFVNSTCSFNKRMFYKKKKKTKETLVCLALLKGEVEGQLWEPWEGMVVGVGRWSTNISLSTSQTKMHKIPRLRTENQIPLLHS